MCTQGKPRGVLGKMQKAAMSAPADVRRGADEDTGKALHAEASVSPFASFKVSSCHSSL